MFKLLVVVLPDFPIENIDRLSKYSAYRTTNFELLVVHVLVALRYPLSKPWLEFPFEAALAAVQLERVAVAAAVEPALPAAAAIAVH